MMYGAIIGDVCGSYYESRRHSTKRKDISLVVPDSRFTDDTVLTVAMADAILHTIAYRDAIRHWYHRYPNAGFGRGFRKWVDEGGRKDNDSWGNGAAMRVSPIAWAFNDIDKVLEEAAQSARPSHSHPEGIKGAQAVAAAVFMARTGADNNTIRNEISSRFGYDMNRTVDSIRPGYSFSSWAKTSVPEAIICFLDSTSFEDAVRNAISLGGDADTQAAIAGAVAEAHYGIPDNWNRLPQKFLTEEMFNICTEFRDKYVLNKI
jgi:ADP-ribosylglycohydrolase